MPICSVSPHYVAFAFEIETSRMILDRINDHHIVVSISLVYQSIYSIKLCFLRSILRT